MPSRGFINLLGPLFTRAFKPGASEVKTVRLQSATDSTTRATIKTPTSGKKIRIISVDCTTGSTTLAVYEYYFGTGANISTNAGSEIAEFVLDAGIEHDALMVWPDGGGPVGAADEVVSFRTTSDITNNARMIIVYREE